MFNILYLSSFFMILSCSDWFLVWMGLEINMISFLLMIYNKFSMNNVESCLKYFFIQSLGSVILFICFYIEYNYMYLYMVIILCYKMGGGPFFFWFSSVCSNISWWSCFFLMSFQKIIPLMLMSLFVSKFIWILSFISLIVGSLGCFNQIEIKMLLAFSSIHHMGWMMMMILVSDFMMLMYLFIYFFVLLNIFIYLNEMQMNFLNMMMLYKNKYMFILSLLSMGGLPPMLGFFLKWLSLYFIMKYNFSLLIIMVLFSVLMLYIYFRMIYDLMLGGNLKLKWIILSFKFQMIFQFEILIILGYFISLYLMLMIMF